VLSVLLLVVDIKQTLHGKGQIEFNAAVIQEELNDVRHDIHMLFVVVGLASAPLQHDTGQYIVCRREIILLLHFHDFLKVPQPLLLRQLFRFLFHFGQVGIPCLDCCLFVKNLELFLLHLFSLHLGPYYVTLLLPNS